MDILFNARFAGLPNTGIGRYFINLLRELPSIAPDVSFFLAAEKAVDPDPDPGYTVNIIPYKNSLFHKDIKKSYWEQVQFRNFASKYPDAIVHIPYSAPYYFGRNRQIITVHDLAPLVFTSAQTGRAGVYDRYYLKMLIPALKRVDCILADSLYTKREIIRLLGYPEKNIEVVYLAADSHFMPARKEDACKSVSEKYGVDSEFILYIGDASFRKNLPGLIKSYARLSEKIRKRFDLVLCGTAKKIPQLHQLASEIDTGRIHFPGFVDNEDMPAIYSAASLFVFPTIYEGFGLPPLEAMCCGTPVVSSVYSSIPEVVGDAGLLVDTNSIEKTAEAMANVLSDGTLMQELSEKGLEKAKEFSWKKTAKRTLEVYRRIEQGV